MNKTNLILDLSNVANKHRLDIDLNMPDFIIGRFLSDALDALMSANKANGEYFKLSAQEAEQTNTPQEGV